MNRSHTSNTYRAFRRVRSARMASFFASANIGHGDAYVIRTREAFTKNVARPLFDDVWSGNADTDKYWSK